MADDEKDGGTSDPKTYSEDEMAAAIAGAKKEGSTESWTHFQGVADKQIATAKFDGTAREAELTKTINSMKADHIQSLPEDQRQAAMVEEMYKDRGGANSSSQAPDNKTTVIESKVSSGDVEKQMRETIGVNLKELGLDPGKIDWGDGKNSEDSLKIFLASVVAQVKAETSGGNGDKSGDKNDSDTKSGENNVDTSRAAGSVHDVYTISPKEVMASGGKKWEPIRGMSEE